MKSEKNTLGVRLRAAREKAGIYQSELAKILDLTSGRIISNWENDIARPDTDNIVKLCKTLNISVAYLLDYHGSVTHENFSNDEIEFIHRLRTLDSYGRDLLETVLEKECERVTACSTAVIIKTRDIPYYDYAASAGTGLYLDNVEGETMTVPLNEVTEDADYVIPVSGDSMEPMFHNGDLICVKEATETDIGEIGIFIINGDAFVKRFEGNRLVSLNKKYHDIPLNGDDSVYCRGVVLGKLDS